MTKEELIKAAVKEYIDSNYSVSLTQLGKKYGVRRQTISEYVKKQGVEVVNVQNLCRLNENVFENIDTEEKAYWLGFLFADGCIYQNEKRFRINLAIKDKDHLEKFAKFLNFTGDIREFEGSGFRNEKDKRFKSCCIQFRNSKIWNDLNSKGCTPNKSLTLKFPDLSIFKSEDLVRHFIRGYVDGDGWLTNSKNKNTYKQQIGAIGTPEFLKGLNDYIKPVNGSIKSKDSEDHPNKAYMIVYHCVAARQVARYLYEDATIYLERKYNKYREFCSFEEGSSRVKSSKIGRDWNVNTEVSA
jgi:intein/homing endonuclease